MGLIIKTTSVISLALRGPTRPLHLDCRHPGSPDRLRSGGRRELQPSEPGVRGLPGRDQTELRPATRRGRWNRGLHRRGGRHEPVRLDRWDVRVSAGSIPASGRPARPARLHGFRPPASGLKSHATTFGCGGLWASRTEICDRASSSVSSHSLPPYTIPDESAPLRETYGDLDGELRLRLRAATYDVHLDGQHAGSGHELPKQRPAPFSARGRRLRSSIFRPTPLDSRPIAGRCWLGTSDTATTAT